MIFRKVISLQRAFLKDTSLGKVEGKKVQGIILRNGKTISVKEKAENEVFDPHQCAVFLDKDQRKIFLWKGSESGMKDRFSAAILADNLDKRIFGGAARVIQDDSAVENAISMKLEDIPQSIIRKIGI